MTALRATHIITSLDADGAQRVLLRLLGSLGERAEAMEVVSLRPLASLAEEIRALGLRVYSLNMRRGVPSPRAALELVGRLRRDRPEVLVTWLYHANLLGAMIRPFVGRLPLVWNVRHHEYAPSHGGRVTAATIRLCTPLSKWAPRRTVFCAASSLESHCDRGYPTSRAVLVSNGFDTVQFRPSAEARLDVRRELRLAPDTPLLGKIGRFHPDKDHQTFLAAAACIAAKRTDVRFLLCGRDVTGDNPTLATWLAAYGLRSRCHLLGPRDDVPRLAASLDIGVSSSVTEAFSNAIGEIMACGVPCVATDVGDSAYVVGEGGRIVPPQEPERLARACLELMELPAARRRQIGEMARRRIAAEFGLSQMAEQHYRVWSAAAEEAGRSPRVPFVQERRRAGRAA